MPRYVFTAERDPKKVGDSGGFRVESTAEYDAEADRTVNITAGFDLTEVYSTTSRGSGKRTAETRGLPLDQIEIELI